MADTKISDMTAAVSVADADLVPVVQGGANKKATAAMIRTGLVSESTVRTANTVLCGPTTGAAAAATFRALVPADIPSLSYQPLDATLTALAALGAGPGFLQVTGADTFSIAALTDAQINTALAYTAANAAALNASNLTTGTIPDARFPAVLPAISGANLTDLPGVSGIVSDAATNTVSDALVIQHATSGTATVGFGTGLLWRGENAVGTMKDMARIDAVYVDAADGSEDARFDFGAAVGGVMTPFMSVSIADGFPQLIGAGGNFGIRVAGALHLIPSGPLYLYSVGSPRWQVDSSALSPYSADGAYDIGTPSARIKDVHAMSVKASGRSYLGVPASAPTDGDIANGASSAYLDEAGNALKIRVRYSDGTLKLATVALA